MGTTHRIILRCVAGEVEEEVLGNSGRKGRKAPGKGRCPGRRWAWLCRADAAIPALGFVTGHCPEGSRHWALCSPVFNGLPFFPGLAGMQRAGKDGKNIWEGWETRGSHSKPDLPMGCSAGAQQRFEGELNWEIETQGKITFSFRGSAYLHSSCSCEWFWITPAPEPFHLLGLMGSACARQEVKLSFIFCPSVTSVPREPECR